LLLSVSASRTIIFNAEYLPKIGLSSHSTHSSFHRRRHTTAAAAVNIELIIVLNAL
jgi:hypothetical protein